MRKDFTKHTGLFVPNSNPDIEHKVKVLTACINSVLGLTPELLRAFVEEEAIVKKRRFLCQQAGECVIAGFVKHHLPEAYRNEVSVSVSVLEVHLRTIPYGGDAIVAWQDTDMGELADYVLMHFDGSGTYSQPAPRTVYPEILDIIDNALAA